MSDPNPFGPPKPEDLELSASEREMLDSNFNNGRGYLDSDVNNSLMNLHNAELDKFDAIVPLQKYEEYLRDRSYRSNTPKEYYDYSMSLADQSKIEAYDAKVTQFNADLERIKSDKDVATAMKISEELSAMLNEARPDFDSIYNFLENSKGEHPSKAKEISINKLIEEVEAIQLDPFKLISFPVSDKSGPSHLRFLLRDMIWSALLDKDRAPIEIKRGVVVSFIQDGLYHSGWTIFKVGSNQVELLRLHEKDFTPPERKTVNKRDIRPNLFA